MKRGFTLIELLVVIGIIGILVAMVMISYNKSRLRARESRRLNDVNELADALELYVSAGNDYPEVATSTVVDTALNTLVTQGYLEVMPRDPKPPGGSNPWCSNYTYISPTGNITYNFRGSAIGPRLYAISFVAETLGSADPQNMHPLNPNVYLSGSWDITNCTKLRASGMIFSSKT